MSMWIKVVTAHDLFEDGALLVYEGEKNFLKIACISERLYPLQLLDINDNVLWGSFYLKKSMLPKIVVKRCLIVMQIQSYTKENMYGAKPQDIFF